ncbi:MAG: pilus assembly protein N-terminal domain-containing protein [Devosia sp.]|jgi:Flp pilus assembly secretin CpaC|nr:pilus assembly protein N-terminal domain-containing protein [Devosiaceae bacterium]
MSPKLGSLCLVAALSAALCVGGTLPAAADETGAPVTVKVNMARILKISAPAATVIVGNPGVADVTIQDPQTLILTGKSYGQTNMIVLDQKGSPIADTLLEVVQAQADTVAVYNANARTTLYCAPRCQQMVMLGDDPSYSQSVTASSSIVAGMASQ